MKRVPILLSVLGALLCMGYTVSPYVSIFMRTVLDDETQGAARTTLGVGETDDPCFAGIEVGVEPNTLDISSKGVLTLQGDAQVWAEDNLQPSADQLPASNPPAEDRIDEFLFDRYDRSTEESTYLTWHVPNDFAITTAGMRGHFEFLVENPPASPSADEVVVMGFEYKKVGDGDVFSFTSGTTSGTISETIVADEAAYTIHETVTGALNTTGFAKGDIILFRFYRDATNVADTYDNEAVAADNDVWVFGYHLEYLRDSLGETQ